MKKLLSFFIIIEILLSYPSFAFENYEFVIPPTYNNVTDFKSFGIASVKDEEGKEGIIDTKGNKIFGFDDTKFVIRRNSLIMAVGENDKAAFFDKSGKRLTDYIYDTYKSENKKQGIENYGYLTDIYDGDGKSNLIPVSRDKKFGFINKLGEEVIKPKYEYVYGFYNGISRTGAKGVLSSYGTYINGKYGYINESGEELYPADSLWYAEDFHNSFAVIKDGKTKVIDKEGHETVLQAESYIPSLKEKGLILAYNNEKTIVYDYNKNVIVDGDYKRKELFDGSVIVDNKTIVSKEGKVLYEAPKDTLIMSSPYGNINFRRISKNISKDEVVSGLINSRGEVIFPCEYNYIREIGEGLIYAEGYRGENILYDESGNEILKLNGQIRGKSKNSLIPFLDFDTMKMGYIKNPLDKKKINSSLFLYNLGLFKGVNEDGKGPDFALLKEPTRCEAIVTIIRVLGKEKEALTYEKTHPFSDVPSWADPYISYAYKSGITKGVSNNLFGESNITTEEYLTLMLRALGYCESDGYTWDNPFSFAKSIGINFKNSVFLRKDMADIIYDSLYVKVKNYDIPLYKKLENEKVIEKGLVSEEKIPL